MGNPIFNKPDIQQLKQKDKFAGRIIQDLKKRSTIGIAFYLLIAAIVFFADSYYSRHIFFSALFLTSIVCVCLFRYVHLYISKKVDEEKVLHHRILFKISVILTSLIWGLGFAVFMVQDGEHSSKLLMAICTAGLCSGGVVAFIPDRKLSLLFNVCMLIPAVVWMLVYDANFPLAMSILLFSIYMVFVMIRGNAEYRVALTNESLLIKKSNDLEKISQVDGLTGLYNRRYFEDILDFHWKLLSRSKTPLTLIMCDIDFFKKINDEHGHLAGDEYLKKTASILIHVFKRETDLVARFGGEEFVILLPGTDTEHVRKMAEHVRCDIESCFLDFKDKKLNTTISLGIASCIPTLDMDRHSLIASADKALYLAKNEGRNCVRIIADPHETASES